MDYKTTPVPDMVDYYIGELGIDGAIRQACDEWHNADSVEEREYFYCVKNGLENVT